MRRVSRHWRRSAALLLLLAVFVAQGAVAAERADGRKPVDRIERAKRFIVIVFTRIGWPPG